MREQNTRPRAERRAEMTAEEGIQDQEIIQHTNEHEESGMLCDF